MALGRISGPMLKANLERLGVDLAFDTDLLYLDISNRRIGINNSNPQYALDVNGPITTDTINADTANINGMLIDSNSITSTSPTLTFSSPDNVIYQNKLIIDGLRFEGNVISTTESNADLELDANGSGIISLLATTNITGDLFVSGNVTIDQDLSIGGNIIIGDSISDSLTIQASIDSDLIPSLTATYNLGSDLKKWKTLYATEAFIDSIHINSNVIETVDSNADLEFRTTGTGVVVVDDLTFDNGTISSTSGNLIFQSQTNVIEMDVTGSVILPTGTTAQRPIIASAGMIRYNSENLSYEGHNGTNWIPIAGVRDEDGDTYITAELTPGANDNTIRFYTNGVLRADINDTRARFDKIEAGEISINGNTITTVSTNQDILLESNGTGSVVIENFSIDSTGITNTVVDSNFNFNITGNSYYKFNGANGIVLPKGTTAQRPSITETGQMRWNTDVQRTEVFNGATWVLLNGLIVTPVTALEAEDLVIEAALTLG